MLDLDRVQELYDLQSSPSATPAEQQQAKGKVAIADQLVNEYLGTLIWEKTGLPKFDCYGAGIRRYQFFLTR